MEARVVTDGEGQKLTQADLPFLIPPNEPANWTLNDFGQPAWIARSPVAALGPWTQIIPWADSRSPGDGAAEFRASRRRDAGDQGAPSAFDVGLPSAVIALGPAAMPAISWTTPHVRRAGRPRIERTAPALAGVAAWLADIRGFTAREVAQALSLSPGLEAGSWVAPDARAVRRAANRYARAGRWALADQGVLPWMAFEDEDGEWDGDRLPPMWWESQTFLDDLHVWQEVSAAQSGSDGAARGQLALEL
jgi:hypothetical protein